MKVFRAIFLLISIPSFGQNGLKGHVVDNDQNPFAALKIEILHQDSVVALTFTDQNGDYSFNNVKPGLYDLRIQHLGFRERIIKNVSIPVNTIEQFDIVHPGPCVESTKVCPGGHSDNLIPIVYGLPSEKLIEKSKEGKVRLGGCIVTGCDPKWYCKEHNIEF
ncbi:MAG TPA: carboxypeptidase-like regulatory domain-containing protein [Cyclobacteriaceae bacterium]